MHCFELIPTPCDQQDRSGFVGGSPLLPAGSEWPRCRICGDDLVHFLDLELAAESTPFKAGSRLQVFACREHDDIAGTIYSDYKKFSAPSFTKELPQNYWDITDGHYQIRLLPPGIPTVVGRAEERLSLQNLRRERHDDFEHDPRMSFKLFGHPSWAQDPEEHVCCCGAPMQMLLQIPEGFGFDMASGAPQQPNSFSSKHYGLFLGNEIYLLACTAQCNPLALWPVLQHS